jgi:hypothetical protein
MTPSELLVNYGHNGLVISVHCCDGARATYFPRLGRCGVYLQREMAGGRESSAVGEGPDRKSGEMSELQSPVSLMAFSASERLRGSHGGYL